MSRRRWARQVRRNHSARGSLRAGQTEGRDALIEQPELAERIQFLQTLTTAGLDELPALVSQLVADLDSKGTYRELGNAIDRWVELDPAGGFAFFVANFSDGAGKFPISLFARRWARLDPDAAVEAGKASAPDSLTSIAEELAAQRPADYFRLAIGGSSDYFRDLPPEAFAADGPAIVPPYPWRPADVAVGLARITEIADPRARETALAWLLAANAASDPQATIAAATEGIGTPASRAPIIQNALASWTASDPPAASAWLAGLEPGSDRDAGIRGLVEASRLGDPGAALEWAQQLSDGEARQGQVANILIGQPRSWAINALDSLGLDAVERTEIERRARLNQASE